MERLLKGVRALFCQRGVIDDRVIHLISQSVWRNENRPTTTYCGQKVTRKSVPLKEGVRWDNPRVCGACLDEHYARQKVHGSMSQPIRLGG